MKASRFNVYVDVKERDEVFLVNTLTGAQVFVSSDTVSALNSTAALDTSALPADSREVLAQLRLRGFVVADDADELLEFEQLFDRSKQDSELLNVTIAVTMQCNFGCDYCFQGSHDEHNTAGELMSAEMADRVVRWLAKQIEDVRPERFELYLFGGEPLLNLPVCYSLAEQLAQVCASRGVSMEIALITNGYLLTRDVVRRLKQYGLRRVKVTLDGDKRSHDSRRHLIGGQGTFDRIIQNIAAVAEDVQVSIGANLDETNVDSFEPLMRFLQSTSFADQIGRVSFGATVRKCHDPAGSPRDVPWAIRLQSRPTQAAALTLYRSRSEAERPVEIDCASLEDRYTSLRKSIQDARFRTNDMLMAFTNPCDAHMGNHYTIGSDGTIYTCAGFSGQPDMAVGHIEKPLPTHHHNADVFRRLSAWRHCGDCALIPVCAGGCAYTAHATFGTVELPTCIKKTYSDSIVPTAYAAAGLANPSLTLQQARSLVRQAGGVQISETPWPVIGGT